MKIVSVVGARPQFIKAAAISRAIAATEGVQEVLVHTGQHYDANMSEVFFEELEIRRPDYHLQIGSGPHGAQTAAMLTSLEELLEKQRPDWVLVYGDTNTTLAGALAAVKMQISIAHVEAGLRSFDRRMPEEINRILTDHASDLLFAPTDAAVRNLAAENLANRTVRTGDVMYDAALHYAELACRTSTLLSRLQLQTREYCLATIHRASNADDPRTLRSICQGLAELSKELPVVLPLHPRTKAAMARFGLSQELPESVQVIEPLGYLDMVVAEKNARLIATDSGGVQKEAFFFQIPCITLREASEWEELIEHGFNRLAAADPDSIVRCARQALESAPNWNIDLYGDGHAAEQIVSELQLLCEQASIAC